MYPNDGLAKERLATAFITTGRMIREIGYFVPPQFEHMYVDNIMMDWGRALNRLVYVDDVLFEHMHYSAQKSKIDPTYLLPSECIRRDKKRYEDFHKLGEFERTVSRLKALMPLER